MSRHATPGPLRLTRRGRIVRDMVGGAGCLALAIAAQPISVAVFTAVAWFGEITGLSA